MRAPILALVGVAALAACGGNSSSQGVCDTHAALEVESVCATGSTLKGIDVSTYQGAVNWSSAKSQGVVFAFARISDGTAHPDDQFTANWKGMKAAGVVRGSYQFWRASVDPTAQANLVISSLKTAGGMETGDLPVVMDLETADGQSSSTIIAHMQTWLAAVEKGTGIKPIIYTSIGTYPITSTMFSPYVLWVANYGVTCPSLPPGWSKWAFWQNADTGVAGGDSDEFDGTASQLAGYTLQGMGGSSSGGSSGSSSGSSVHDGGTGSSSGGGSGSGSGGSSGSGSGGSSGSGSGGKGGFGSSGGKGHGGSSGGDAGATMGSSSGGGATDDAGAGSSSGCSSP